VTFHRPIVGEFGHAAVVFPRADMAIPAELQVEFELLRLSEREPEVLREWTDRLERLLRREAAPPPWSILRVSPNMERKVRDALSDAGLTVYVPLEKYRLPRARSWRSRTRPLIPGYIFASLQDDEQLDLARSNHAVRDVMARDGKPLGVPALSIAALILAEASGEFDQTWNAPAPLKDKRRGRRPSKAWQKGQRVKVTEGPFAGFPAEIMSADRADRIETLVMIFGRATPVTLDEDMLEFVA
jgi:transcription antitermination factor NusG